MKDSSFYSLSRNLFLSLLLVFSSSLFSSDWEKVDPAFAQAYEESREILNQMIQQARAQGRSINTGAQRAQRHQDDWKKVSLSRKLHIYYGNQEIDYLPQRRGKVYIELSNMYPGQEYIRIVFDASGDYYRVERGTYTGQSINTPNSEFHRYLDAYGDEIIKPDGLNFYEWRNFFREKTHFKATP